jgi:hypothetical protein
MLFTAFPHPDERVPDVCKLDPMALLEEVMQHFYRKAKIEESLGRFCDFRIVDNAAAECGAECARDCEFSSIRVSVP